MGSELLKEERNPQKSYTDIFNEIFPNYLAIGMTYDQFFNEDVYLVKHFAKAVEIRNKKENEKMWLQGLYIYNALSVVHYNLNRKKGEKTIDYPSKPFDLFTDNSKETKDLRIKEEQARAETWMRNFVNAHKI